MEDGAGGKRGAGPGLGVVSVVQWLLPLGMAAVAATYETLEHLVLGGSLPPRLSYAAEVVFFALVGPIATAVTLAYVRRLLRDQVAARATLDRSNRELEERVAERTRHLDEARAGLQRNLQSLSAANDELRRLDRMKSEFVALVSHSFKAPLASLRGTLEVVSMDWPSLPPGTRTALTLLGDEEERLRRLVDNILDLSRLEAGKLKLNPGPVALAPLLRRAAEAAGQSSPGRRVEVSHAGGLPPAWADEVYVEEVLTNLLSNAIKYSPEGSPVSVSAELAGERLAVCVEDRGPGIPLEERESLFRPFQRGEEGERRDTGGLGLGLYFARRLVEAQGGRIWVESPAAPEGGQPGARLVFTLPVAGEVPGVEEEGGGESPGGG